MQGSTDIGNPSRVKAWTIVLIAYVLAGLAALVVGIIARAQPPPVVIGLADLVATIVVFVFSVITRNSSMYDPYWSVAPVPIALYWLLQPGSDGLANPRHVLIFVLLCIWAVRLTGNWALQWRGLEHEDWRYRDIQRQTGAWYWPVSFLGIHLMPTILVFLGCLALWPTLSDRNVSLSWLDILAALVTLGAVLIEGTADSQMRRFRRAPDYAERAIPPGLWSVSRHPNYFGEVLFWWGLYLFVPLVYPGLWWVIVSTSIPLMERHLRAGHPAYEEYQRHVSAFFPWFRR
jgi:steroid 5-alpha reductase family enzyme